MIIKRPLTNEQKKALSEPSKDAQLQALKDLAEYTALKLLKLEENHNGNLPSVQSKVDYTC